MKKGIIAVLVVALAAVLVYGFSFNTQPKQAYIDNLKLYGEFELTKELNRSIVTIEQQRKAGLDSVEVELKMLSRQIEMNEGSDENQIRLFRYKQSEYQMKNQQMNEELEKLNNDYNNKIWTRLNDYVSEYGKQNGYQILFGGMGEGTVMYCDSTIDITSEVLNYVNEKYNGNG